MTGRDVARALREIGQLLQLKGENAFKVRAYEVGAEAFESLPADPAAPGGLRERVAAGTLTELAGVGKAIAEKATALVTTGQIPLLEQLRAEVPRGAAELVKVGGVGPRKAIVLANEGIDSVEALEEACRAGRVRGLPGFGERTEAQILESVVKLRDRSKRRPLGESRKAALLLLERVRAAPGVVRAEIGGSIRRYSELVGDLDLVAAVEPGANVGAMEAFSTAPGVEEILVRGETQCSVRLRDGQQADLRAVRPDQFATAFHHLTGSKQHHVKLRGLARARGLTLSEYGLAPLDPEAGPPLVVREEADIYRHLGLAPVPAELREDQGELEAAQAAPALPRLIDAADIKGFVHCHSTWSDGAASIEQMVRAAKERGRQFITISDHTQAAHYAGGLTPDRLKQQWDEIAEVEARVGGIRVLRGSEVDILEDGRLDLPDEILAQLDVVIVSVHQRFKLDEDRQTERVRRALSHPLCRIWGHPTGRTVGEREELPLRMEELLALCAEKGVVVECNGTPRRLDLSSAWLREARKAGCAFSLSVDAHSTDELDNLHYAAGTARRAGVTPAEVVNAGTADEFLARLRPR